MSASPDSKSYIGYLEIDPIRGGKGKQAATLHTLDGKRLILAQRYRPIHLELANLRVVVHGHITQSSTDEAPQGYSYLETEHIRMAPGQSEHDPPLKQVPSPPVARSKQDLDRLPGVWRMAMGTCRFTLAPLSSGSNGRVVERVDLELEDGYVLTKDLHLAVEADTRYVDGAKGSMLVELGPPPEKAPIPMAFCVGEDRRCGM